MSFFALSKDGSAAPAPQEYIEMRLLPQQGWAYSEVQRLTLAERHTLFRLLEIEGQWQTLDRGR